MLRHSVFVFVFFLFFLRNWEASGGGFIMAVDRSDFSGSSGSLCGREGAGPLEPDPQPTGVLLTVWRAVGPAAKETDTRKGRDTPACRSPPASPPSSLTGGSGPGPGSYFVVSTPRPQGSASASSPPISHAAETRLQKGDSGSRLPKAAYFDVRIRPSSGARHPQLKGSGPSASGRASGDRPFCRLWPRPWVPPGPRGLGVKWKCYSLSRIPLF